MFDLFKPRTKPYRDLNGREFRDAYRNSARAVLLDVRTPAEFSAGTIRGAKNLDLTSAKFHDAVAKLDKDAEYFVFCRSGARSAQACSIMAKHGLKAANLAGGIGAWPA